MGEAGAEAEGEGEAELLVVMAMVTMVTMAMAAVVEEIAGQTVDTPNRHPGTRHPTSHIHNHNPKQPSNETAKRAQKRTRFPNPPGSSSPRCSWT